MQSVDLEIDESSLTGENAPVVKSIDCIPQTPPGHTLPVTDRHNTVFMGTLVTHGSASGIVVATASTTEFGIIHSSLSTIAKPKTPLQQSMDHLGKQLSYVSFVVIGVIVVIGVVQGRHWLEMTTIGVSLAVAAIPEGLPIIVTVTLALGVLRMAGKRVIVRRLSGVETLGSVNVVCSDKTGFPPNLHMWSVSDGRDVDDESYDDNKNVYIRTRRYHRRGKVNRHNNFPPHRKRTKTRPPNRYLSL